MKKEYLSPTEAAKILKISRQAVINRIKHGTLIAEKAGRQYIISKTQIKPAKNSTKARAAISTSSHTDTKHEKIKEILDVIAKHSIKTIQLWFVDILGILKCVSITEGELKEALEHGKGFDGSSVAGFAEAEESDILAQPDLNTFKILPWTKETGPMARMFCDILNPDRTPYPGDPRYVLKRAIERAKKLGLTFYLGAEIEYFYFKSDKKPEIIDEGSYFELIPNDLADTLRNKTVRMLEELGIQMEATHHFLLLHTQYTHH